MSQQLQESPVVTGLLYAEVQHFYAHHMQLLDRGRDEEWAATFTEDGSFLAPSLPEPVRGRARLAAAVRRTAAQLAELGETHRHWHGMIDVTAGTGGELLVRCYAVIYAIPRGGEPRLHLTCVCEDVLVRGEGGELLVRDRRVTRDDQP